MEYIKGNKQFNLITMESLINVGVKTCRSLALFK